MEVATHRHGCCVIQRCIDAASEQQKIQLVSAVTFNALALIQVRRVLCASEAFSLSLSWSAKHLVSSLTCSL